MDAASILFILGLIISIPVILIWCIWGGYSLIMRCLYGEPFGVQRVIPYDGPPIVMTDRRIIYLHPDDVEEYVASRSSSIVPTIVTHQPHLVR